MSTVVFAYDWDLSLFCVSIESHKKAEDVLQIKLDEIGLSAECFSRYTDSLRPYIETMSQVCARLCRFCDKKNRYFGLRIPFCDKILSQIPQELPAGTGFWTPAIYYTST